MLPVKRNWPLKFQNGQRFQIHEKRSSQNTSKTVKKHQTLVNISKIAGKISWNQIWKKNISFYQKKNRETNCMITHFSEKNSISRENALSTFDHKIQHPIWATFPSNSGDSNDISVIA